jgi:hypothetical protein
MSTTKTFSLSLLRWGCGGVTVIRGGKVRRIFSLPMALLLLASPSLSGRAATYYVDSERGQDTNAGTSKRATWMTLDKVNNIHFLPGDRILFHAARRWKGQLTLHDSGTKGKPIFIDSYGNGPLPRIDGEGKTENVIQIVNLEQIEVRHLEITNHGDQAGVRRGVLIEARNIGTLHHVVVGDLFIHDVNGTNTRKDVGGILFRTIGDEQRSRFDGLLIERNILWKVDRTAIVAESTEAVRTKWFPSLNVIIRGNYAEDIGGDGIVPWATDGALVEFNVVLRCNQRAGTYNAGIWPWSTDNTLVQFNEAAYTHGTQDGEGFDSDFNSRNSYFLYNYSHDNDGGFMLICSPHRHDPSKNAGNTGTLVQYNISRNDHARIINLSGADQVTVEHNAFYVAPNDDVQGLLTSDWEGWTKGAIFRDNTFDSAGVIRFGHAVHRNEDGTYQLRSGWGEAEEISFVGNRYWGHQMDIPRDLSAKVDPVYHPVKLDWHEPLFHPSRPKDYAAYLERHREWLLRLLKAQFGEISAASPSQIEGHIP